MQKDENKNRKEIYYEKKKNIKNNKTYLKFLLKKIKFVLFTLTVFAKCVVHTDFSL